MEGGGFGKAQTECQDDVDGLADDERSQPKRMRHLCAKSSTRTTSTEADDDESSSDEEDTILDDASGIPSFIHSGETYVRLPLRENSVHLQSGDHQADLEIGSAVSVSTAGIDSPHPFSHCIGIVCRDPCAHVDCSSVVSLDTTTKTAGSMAVLTAATPRMYCVLVRGRAYVQIPRWPPFDAADPPGMSSSTSFSSSSSEIAASSSSSSSSAPLDPHIGGCGGVESSPGSPIYLGVNDLGMLCMSQSPESAALKCFAKVIDKSADCQGDTSSCVQVLCKISPRYHRLRDAVVLEASQNILQREYSEMLQTQLEESRQHLLLVKQEEAEAARDARTIVQHNRMLGLASTDDDDDQQTSEEDDV
jgi:hypothetical protein